MEYVVNPKKAIGTLIAFILVCLSLWRAKAIKKDHKTKRSQVPTPSGALPIIGHLHLLGSHNPKHRTLGAMADKYGPAIMLRLGVYPTLVVSSWELVKDCFTASNWKVFATRPRFAAAKYLGYNYAISGSTPYGTYWRGMRKMATLELLSKTRLHKLKHIRVSVIDLSIKELYSLWAKDGGTHPVKVEMRQWFEQMSLNIITEMIASKRYYGNMITGYKDEAQRFRKATAQLMYFFGMFVVSDALPYCEWLDFGGHIKEMKNVATEFDSLIGNWLEEHRLKIAKKKKKGAAGEESELDDFIDVMLSTLPEDNFQSNYDQDTIIKATVLQFITAAVDTTSIAMTWVVSFLMNNHHVLQKAQDEIAIHVGRDRNVEENDIENLPYLKAIIKETLRICPPSPLGLLHEAMEDCEVGGYHVPKGTRLVVNIWKLHHDPHVWPDPHEFKPERFLTTHADIDVKGQNFELIPFGSGIRWCPGFDLATQIVHLALARLLHAFNLDTLSNSPVDMTEGLGITMPRAIPLEILLSPRLPSELY
ncbi:xanthotoxin 5-hydroxylase CYP82C4-like [Macadamia integrifolia]|uniref:xanthotoxin 5-hydroxylase CYP82C4-like n=1 Tax=Macadamia integrifolia TaxID=60698 RepID=UPI001C4ECFD7|nr:xanthotoxin 5-hydroxylase CYP82C4-like [Macadamia integrifolia]